MARGTGENNNFLHGFRTGWESLLELHGEEQKNLTAIRDVLTGSEAVRWQDQTSATSSTKERTAGVLV